MERINDRIKFGDTKYAIEVEYKSSNGEQRVATLYLKAMIKESKALEMIIKDELGRGAKAVYIESIKVAEAYTPMEFHFPSRTKYKKPVKTCHQNLKKPEVSLNRGTNTRARARPRAANTSENLISRVPPARGAAQYGVGPKPADSGR